MLCGQGVIAIWNDITDEGRAEFYAWHVMEHMPERIGIPGFMRGRRYRAIDRQTHPEFFTLYELQSFAVASGQDYMNRLNAPTPWTKTATAAFCNTSRGVGRVLASIGPGSGGALGTVRFSVTADRERSAAATLIDLMRTLANLPMVTGIHLAKADVESSGVKTAESSDRKDIQAPPNWFVLIEACTPASLDSPINQLVKSEFIYGPDIGRYAHEYTRLKTDQAPG